MAPITATSTGIQPQVIDDVELSDLIVRLNAFDTSGSSAEVDVSGLVRELEHYSTWKFQELADLYEWIRPLNAIDAALRLLMEQYPHVLLIATKDPKGKRPAEPTKQAESESDANAVPSTVIHSISVLLRFLVTLLRHSYNKSLFNSVYEISNLLAAADDGIAALALNVLFNLAISPLLHRMQVQETGNHTTMLHSASSSYVHTRLMLLARGWGTRGSGLGLLDCVTFDDSRGVGGQGSLPAYAGEVDYDFIPPSAIKAVKVQLMIEDILQLPQESLSPEHQNEKRRKMSASARTKSTASLFFDCLLNKIGGRDRIDPEKAFGLLVHIRLAKAFHCRETRVRAVEHRLWALNALLYAHPSEALVGYFHAQPELCSEIVDLLRPMVSSNSVSEVGAMVHADDEQRRAAAIKSIVDPISTHSIPFEIRLLALETLNAIIFRRDERVMTGVSNIAKQTNILSELGITKGQSLGLLPTLIRYSLASLNSFISDNLSSLSSNAVESESSLDIEKLNLDSGLSFLEATKPSSSAEKNGDEEKAFLFIETVLFLATSIITTTNGTPALTDCGLIPAIVSNISISNKISQGVIALPFNNLSAGLSHSGALRYITAVSIQVLEGAIVTHNPALLAFHELKVVDILVSLLWEEFKSTEASGDNVPGKSFNLEASRRVLLYSILNCLTIVLHHQETQTRSSSPSISAVEVLKRPEMTYVLNQLLRNINSFGGVLGALAVTLVTDTINTDPKVTHYILESGIAESFFFIMKGEECSANKKYDILDVTQETWHEANVPCSSELIMALPNLISALCLTEDGRKRVTDVNPFPDMLGIMASPRFVMPNSRCLLNEMASMIGGSVDEFIRHVPSMKSLILESFVRLIDRVVFLGRNVSKSEDEWKRTREDSVAVSSMNQRLSRVCLLHYGNNIAQLLEQILRTEENCEPFIQFGGYDSLLHLYPCLTLRGKELLSHLSSQSAPAVANISHSTVYSSFTTAFKRLAVVTNPLKAVATIKEFLKLALEQTELSISHLMCQNHEIECPNISYDLSQMMKGIPKLPLHLTSDSNEKLNHLSHFFESILNVEWLSQLMAAVVRIVCQRSPEWTPWRSGDPKTFLAEIASLDFVQVMDRLSVLFRSSSIELCKIRSESDFESRDLERWKTPGISSSYPAIYVLRIVCSDGAIVRDGIDIDSCTSVGGLEMGEEIFAYERCINRSGIMRYRTGRGWISEQTRGHGREPIAEVIEVCGVGGPPSDQLTESVSSKKSSYCGIADLHSLTASVLARLQSSQCNLYSSLSRVVMVGLRRSDNYQSDCLDHTQRLVCHIGDFLRTNFSVVQHESDNGVGRFGSKGAVCLFLGNMLSIFHSCIHEERREKKQFLNIALFANMLFNDSLFQSFLLDPKDKIGVADRPPKLPLTAFEIYCSELDERDLKLATIAYDNLDDVTRAKYTAKAACLNAEYVKKKSIYFDMCHRNFLPSSGFYAAIRTLIRFSLEEIAAVQTDRATNISPSQTLSRAVAASLPSAISLLRKLSSQSLSIDSSMSESIGKLEKSEFMKFLSSSNDIIASKDDLVFSFRQGPLARSVHYHIGAITLEFWADKNLRHCPAHLLYPILGLVKDAMHCLKESIDRKDSRIPSQSESDSPFSMNIGNAISLSLSQSTMASSLGPRDNADVVQNSEAVVQQSLKDKVDAKKRYDTKSSELIADIFERLKTSLIYTALDILYKPEDFVSKSTKFDELKESESCAIISASFLSDMCFEYAFEKEMLVSSILDRILSCFELTGDTKHSHKLKRVMNVPFASLCLTAVVLLRAFPGTRILVTKRNLVKIIVQCIRSVTKNSDNSSALPLWLSPALLFLEVMAKPIILSSDVIDSVADFPGRSANEFERICHEHKKQKLLLQKTSKKINAALSQKSSTDKQSDKTDSTKSALDIPAFAPLMTTEAADHCLMICLQLLKLKNRVKSDKSMEGVVLSSNDAHATLLLLTRILSFRKVASRFLQLNGADALLSLPPKSRFKGHTELLTLAFRRMMEDENTLMSLTEGAIRTALLKLNRKQLVGDIDVPAKAFLKAMIPWICRDPVIFMRAAAVTISVQLSTSTISSDGNVSTRVQLLSSEDRHKNIKLMNDSFRMVPTTPSDTKTPLKVNDLRPSTECLSITPGGDSTKLESKTEKSTSTHRDRKTPRKDKSETEIFMNASTASNHIISCICNEIVKANEKHSKFQAANVPFLCVHDYFDILGDLILLIPSCAPSLCNHRIPLQGRKNHYRSAIGYFIHVLLPQQREMMNIPDENRTKDEIEIQKRHYYLCLRIAQSCARTLLALVARPGEGRRKVLCELSDALCGKNAHFKTFFSMQSTLSWGELCIGLAAPRKSSNSNDSDSSLSLEVIKVMMESAMAESILHSVQEIDLNHPLASLAATNLLRSLEIFTRRTVVDSIIELVEKEKKRSNSNSSFMKDNNKRLDADNEFLDSGSDRSHASDDESESDNNRLINENTESSGSSGDENDTESSDDDIIYVDTSDEEDMISINEGHSMSESQSSDEQSYDSDDSMDDDTDHDQDEVIEMVDDEMESEDEGESIVDEENDSNEDEEGNDDEDDNMNDDNIFGHDFHENEDNHDFFEEDEDAREDEQNEDEVEGWTNVGHGGATFGFESLFNSSRNAFPVGRPRAPTGVIEAAATFIGNILQNSEIPAHALEQLQQIGIPVSRRTLPIDFLQRNDREVIRSNRNPLHSNDSNAFPPIHQIHLPDNGFSHPTTGRTTDVNFMEYLYGGLVIGSSRVHYDLLPSLQEDSDVNSHFINVPSVAEIELFPGGPSANTSPRHPETPHILLAGVRLPPFNSLISSASRNEDIIPSRRRDLTTHPFEFRVFDLTRGIDRSISNVPVVSRSEGDTSDGAETFCLAFESAISAFTTPAHVLEPHTSSVTENASVAQNDVLEVGANTGVSSNFPDGAQGDDFGDNSNIVRINGSETVSSLSELLVQNNTVGDESQIGDNIVNAMNTHDAPEASAERLPDTIIGDIESNRNNLPQSSRSENDGDSIECPLGIDPEVFGQLPLELQREIIREHEVSSEIASHLRTSSVLDPEALAALPDDMRLEVLQQERHNAEQRNETPADPSRAEDMDSASFIASLSPDLRDEILLTADDDFLNSLPPEIRTEAQVLRERAMMSNHQDAGGEVPGASISRHRSRQNQQERPSRRRPLKKKPKSQVRVDCNRSEVVYAPPNLRPESRFLINPDSLKSLIDLMFLLSPVRPQRILQKLFFNLSYNPEIRKALAMVFIALLNDEPNYAVEVIKGIGSPSKSNMEFSACLIGPPPVTPPSDSATQNLIKNNVSSAASTIAINLPASSRGSRNSGSKIPPVVAKRLVGTLIALTKSGSRLPVDILSNFSTNSDDSHSSSTYLDTILSLLAKPTYSESTSNLEELLIVIDNICTPLDCIPCNVDDVVDPTPKDIEVAHSLGKEYVKVPRTVVAPPMLKLLCSILRLDSCKDAIFGKVMSIFKRLSRVDANRKCILDELAIVAQALGSICIRDLRTLKIQLELAAQSSSSLSRDNSSSKQGMASSGITLSTSSIDLKLLRVLQSLFLLDRPNNIDTELKVDSTMVASPELVSILSSIHLENLWSELTSCLNVVSFLEGVDHLKIEEDEDDKKSGEDGEVEEDDTNIGKKLQSTVAGLLTRFLPTIESFFIVNTCLIEKKEGEDQSGDTLDRLVGGPQVLKFVSANKVLLNALLRSSPTLLDKNLRALVTVPKCCAYLDFDVKRSWFKQQLRKLRTQASRRHGSLRLNIRRSYVFEDAYRQLSLRTAEEMRGRLHVTFVNEEGVDAGGLSREFFGILAKEMFNPNYALFTSTEDGCTFQPNPHSSINREHLDYFRFVGRIVGKAVADSFLLDAHFTRSLYKHMLGMKPTYQDMQAIDPDFYKNLKMILDYNLEDIGLDLTFSTMSYWFGRAQTIDLIPNGKNITVTESDKEKYVDLVCQYRMTTSIEKQLDAFLFGFHELVKPDMIGVFSPRELELIISGMPDIDISDLKMNTEYHGWRPVDEEICWFWNILFSLPKSDKAAFLQFVTGSSKVPLNGFSELQGMRGTQKFSIHKAGGPEGALMSAHTCFNSLDLPVYKSEEEMREKLMYAIKEGSSGFLFA